MPRGAANFPAVASPDFAMSEPRSVYARDEPIRERHRTQDRICRYRQGKFVNLWIVAKTVIADFAQALTGSPRVDVAMLRRTNKNTDFLEIFASLQFQQLDFASQFAVEQYLTMMITVLPFDSDRS
jgi:hypothetical protein